MQLYMLLWNQETCNCDIIAMDRRTQLRNGERNAQIMTFRQTRNILVVAFTHKLFKLCLIFVHFDFSPSSDAAALWLSVKVCHSLCWSFWTVNCLCVAKKVQRRLRLFCKLGYTAQILIQNDKIMFASKHLRESSFWYSPNPQPRPSKIYSGIVMCCCDDIFQRPYIGLHPQI